MTVWCNGHIVDGALALDPNDRGLLLGDGLFETIAVRQGQPMWLAAHLDRLAQGAVELGIPFNGAAAQAGVAAVLAEEVLPFAALRITLSRGAAGRGLAGNGDAPTLLISMTAMAQELIFAPCSLGLVDVVRHRKSPTTRLKTLSYGDNIMAARQALALGFDDGLMLNEQGHVACATIGNVFVVQGRRLLTPALDQAILPGIVRAMVITLAAELGLMVRETCVTLDDMTVADGVFITNSLRILRPVARFGERRLIGQHTELIAALRATGGL